MLDALKTYLPLRNRFISQFCQPYYEAFLTEAILKGRIKANGFFTDPAIRLAYSGVYWVAPTIGNIDEVKEVTAAKLRVQNGFSTWQAEAEKLTGSDFKDVCRAQYQERKMQKEYELNFIGEPNISGTTERDLTNREVDNEKENRE
jgi:capsid protein